MFEAAVPASPEKEGCLHGTASLRVYAIYWNFHGYAFNKNQQFVCAVIHFLS